MTEEELIKQLKEAGVKVVEPDPQRDYANAKDLDSETLTVGEAMSLVYEVSRGVRDFATVSGSFRSKVINRIEAYIRTNTGLYRSNVRAKYIKHGTIQSGPFTLTNDDLFIYRPKAEWKINESIALRERRDAKEITWEEYTRAMGKLFSYSEKEIERFIEKYYE